MSAQSNVENESLASFQVSGLLNPLNDGLYQLQQRIMQEKNDDPVPKVSLEEIQEVVGVLAEAVTTMEESMCRFTPSGIQAMDEVQLNIYQEKVREASRWLTGFLFGDGNKKFRGSMEHGAFALRVHSQSTAVKNRLQGYVQFLQVFHNALTMLPCAEVQKKYGKINTLLNALLNPQKIQWNQNRHGGGSGYPQIPGQKHMNNPLQAEADKMKKQRDEASRKQQQLQSKRQSQRQPQYGYSHGVRQEVDPAEMNWQNGQDQLATYPDSLQELQNLQEMVHTLSKYLKADHAMLQEQKTIMSQKMESLASFADIIEKFIVALKSCMLLHLPELKMGDDIIRQWISEKEANDVHRKLEECRDGISEEKVLRRLSAAISTQQAPNGAASETSWDLLSDREQASLRARVVQVNSSASATLA